MLDALRRQSPTADCSGGRPWTQSAWAALGLAGLLSAAVGVAAAVLPNPLYLAVGLVALVLLGVMLWRTTAGLFAFIAVVATLPFGVIPVRFGVQLTFVDAVLLATFFAFFVRVPGLASRRERGLMLSGPGLALLLFVAVSVAAFVLGNGLVPVGAEGSRRFAKLLVSLLFFLVALNLLLTGDNAERRLVWVARGLIMGGSLAGALAAGLWLLPATRQLELLNRLGSLGYPTGASVLRYEPGANDTYTDQLRAIGTAVDPNVLGGTLMLAAALSVIQLFAARRPVFPRFMLLLLALPTLAGLLLSFSRASWVGLAAGVLLLGRRSRGTWIAAGAGILLLLASPIGQRVVTRFVSGLSAADPATALRLGEFRNAITLVSRYPVFGIGFGTSPDIDVSAGVSSVYLLIAEQTGLVGLACFLLAVGLVVRRGLRTVSASSSEDGPAAGIAAGTLAAFAGALVAGLADHYFANQVFPHAVALFWLYAAVLIASVRLMERATPSAAPAANDGSIGARPAERQAARGPRRSAEC